MAVSKSKLKPDLPGQQPSPHTGRVRPLARAPTGIARLDMITAGGLPRGRPTLVCGGAGCGKTLLGLEFLLRGALDYGEPGVFVAFEETELEPIQNVASSGFDLKDLIARKLPQPINKIIGELSRSERVLVGLDVVLDATPGEQ